MIARTGYLKVRCIERHWYFLPAHRVTYFATDVVVGPDSPHPARKA